jgi:pimeloyl-ACP methyl ester carboxylesterase
MLVKVKILIFCLSLSFTLCSCSYLKYAIKNAEYARIQNAEPGQVNLKHMIEQESFFVYGKTADGPERYYDHSMAVAAYSSKFKENERVDTMFFDGRVTYFALNLPEGAYKLLVFADKDKNKIFDKSEVVGQKDIVLNKTSAPQKSMKLAELELTESRQVDWVDPITMPEIAEAKKSLYYPAGTIRSFDDPIFDEAVATLGMYDPAAFNEKAHFMFFALEEISPFKIPVIFVHGVGGSIRQFKPIVERMDRTRYNPWFFYYPSGGDLNHLAEIFYSIYLSGKGVSIGEVPFIIVAHSMGGLVVREALNQYEGKQGENKVKLFVTIASPLGGHSAAALGEKHGLIVLPAWRDVNPNNRFIKELYRKPLPESINHQLLYAFGNPGTVKLGENSDGVVSLSSQLHPEAQKQSNAQFGFNSNHNSILENEEMISYLLDKMSRVKNVYPESHLEVLSRGGYDVELSDDYSPKVQYVIRYFGKYLMAITNGTLEPIYPFQENLKKVANGEASPADDMEKGWLRFMKEYPEFFRNSPGRSGIH